MNRCIALLGALTLLGCNDAKTVDPQTPSSTPVPSSEAVKADPPTETPMAHDKEPQIHALGIADAEFFDGGTRKAMAAARKELRKSKTASLRIDAPFVVDTAAQSTLPVLGVFGRSAGDEADLAQSSIVVGVDLSGGGFHAAPALRSSKLGGKGGAAKAGAKGDATPAFVASSFELDVLERLPDLPRTGATHKLYVIQGEFLSNGVATSLGGEAATAPPVVPDSLAAQTTKHADSPAAPATHGVALKVPARGVSEPGGSVMLHGTVRASGETTRVFLLATSDKSSGPFSFTIDVPLADGVGHFNIDIVADEGPPKRPAQWHWYAFSGEHRAGPASVGLDPGKPW